MRSMRSWRQGSMVLAAVFLLPCCVFFVGAPSGNAQTVLPADVPAVTRYADAPLALVKERARDGEDAAELELGLRYVLGSDGVRNVPAGVKWIGMAAKKGMPQAEHEFGSLYLMGVGVPQSDALAVQWFRKAAIQGYAPSQTAMGFAYENGAGVPRNPEKAAYWFDKAASQGNGIAEESVEGGM
ncbi:tetratricopeptide repeat protein [Oxalobacter paraformigenes]|nr:tetratricopeptide repeat protein [Oxalobacter paraformigenes]